MASPISAIQESFSEQVAKQPKGTTLEMLEIATKIVNALAEHDVLGRPFEGTLEQFKQDCITTILAAYCAKPTDLWRQDEAIRFRTDIRYLICSHKVSYLEIRKHAAFLGM